MVNLVQVRASNALIASDLPSRLVAVFVGATSGIGEYTLRAFVKHATEPRIYFVGRSQEAGERITDELRKINTQGEYTFIRSDVSLLKNVDDVCRTILAQEKTINLLVLSQGTLVFGTETDEGLHYAAALVHHSRLRFMVNLIPLLQAATALRRVVSIFTGTKEGPLDVQDIQARNVPFKSARGHASSLVTFDMEAVAQRAPSVSMVHVFPGHVKSGIIRGTTGILMGTLKILSEITGLFLRMNPEECGERHVFLCTNGRYAARKSADGDGLKVMGELQTAVGTDGEVGSGVYSVDEYGESAGQTVIDVLSQMRGEDIVSKIWQASQDDFKRITGVAVLEQKN